MSAALPADVHDSTSPLIRLCSNASIVSSPRTADDSSVSAEAAIAGGMTAEQHRDVDPSTQNRMQTSGRSASGAGRVTPRGLRHDSSSLSCGAFAFLRDASGVSGKHVAASPRGTAEQLRRQQQQRQQLSTSQRQQQQQFAAQLQRHADALQEMLAATKAALGAVCDGALSQHSASSIKQRIAGLGVDFTSAPFNRAAQLAKQQQQQQQQHHHQIVTEARSAESDDANTSTSSSSHSGTLSGTQAAPAASEAGGAEAQQDAWKALAEELASEMADRLRSLQEQHGRSGRSSRAGGGLAIPSSFHSASDSFMVTPTTPRSQPPPGHLAASSSGAALLELSSTAKRDSVDDAPALSTTSDSVAAAPTIPRHSAGLSESVEDSTSEQGNSGVLPLVSPTRPRKGSHSSEPQRRQLSFIEEDPTAAAERSSNEPSASFPGGVVPHPPPPIGLAPQKPKCPYVLGDASVSPRREHAAQHHRHSVSPHGADLSVTDAPLLEIRVQPAAAAAAAAGQHEHIEFVQSPLTPHDDGGAARSQLAVSSISAAPSRSPSNLSAQTHHGGGSSDGGSTRSAYTAARHGTGVWADTSSLRGQQHHSGGGGGGGGASQRTSSMMASHNGPTREDSHVYLDTFNSRRGSTFTAVGGPAASIAVLTTQLANATAAARFWQGEFKQVTGTLLQVVASMRKTLDGLRAEMQQQQQQQPGPATSLGGTASLNGSATDPYSAFAARSPPSADFVVAGSASTGRHPLLLDGDNNSSSGEQSGLGPTTSSVRLTVWDRQRFATQVQHEQANQQAVAEAQRAIRIRRRMNNSNSVVQGAAGIGASSVMGMSSTSGAGDSVFVPLTPELTTTTSIVPVGAILKPGSAGSDGSGNNNGGGGFSGSFDGSPMTPASMLGDSEDAARLRALQRRLSLAKSDQQQLLQYHGRGAHRPSLHLGSGAAPPPQPGRRVSVVALPPAAAVGGAGTVSPAPVPFDLQLSLRNAADLGALAAANAAHAALHELRRRGSVVSLAESAQSEQEDDMDSSAGASNNNNNNNNNNNANSTLRVQRSTTIEASAANLSALEDGLLDPDAFQDGAPTLNGYQILSHIATGSQGSIVLAVDIETAIPYAIKVIARPLPSVSIINEEEQQPQPMDESSDEQRLRAAAAGGRAAQAQRKRVQQLRREIQALMRLRHPHVVRLHEVIDDPGSSSLFLVMEYLAGVAATIDAAGRLDRRYGARTIIAWGRQLFSALDYCHNSASCVHRDISVANILLDHDSSVKIGDWGLAKLVDAGEAARMRQLARKNSNSAAAAQQQLQQQHHASFSSMRSAASPVDSASASRRGKAEHASMSGSHKPTFVVPDEAPAEEVRIESPTMAVATDDANDAEAGSMHSSPLPLAHERTAGSFVLGTAAFRAPELFRDTLTDAESSHDMFAADVFSLSLVLYALLYGRLPFSVANRMHFMNSVEKCDVPFPPEWLGLPKDGGDDDGGSDEDAEQAETRRKRREEEVRAQDAQVPPELVTILKAGLMRDPTMRLDANGMHALLKRLDQRLPK